MSSLPKPTTVKGHWRPSVDQLKTLMNIGEAFLYRTIILDAEAQRLKKSIPKRKP